MKNRVHKNFFSMVVFGSCSLYGAASNIQVEPLKESSPDYRSLQERSPFGDKPPPPPPKPAPLPVKLENPPPPPPSPKKSDMKFKCTGYFRRGDRDCFAICDMTPKDAKDHVHMVLAQGKKSPLGYVVTEYNKKEQTIAIEFNGQRSVCQIGEDSNNKNGNNIPNNLAPSNQSSNKSWGNWKDWDDDFYDFDDSYDFDSSWFEDDDSWM